LLFDEVQKMRRETFQGFLKELRDRFDNSERNIHTMQCHSMASLDDTRKLREELGDWMMQAERIQLPSIEMAHAYDFYRQRIVDSGGDAEARELIGKGLAQTLCEATGGNPRQMLQIAGDVRVYLSDDVFQVAGQLAHVGNVIRVEFCPDVAAVLAFRAGVLGQAQASVAQ
jgi:hypothetical protein